MEADAIQIFREVDVGGKGWLTRRELKLALLSLLGYKPSRFEVNKFLPEAETEPTSMTPQRFIECALSYRHCLDDDETVRQLFLIFDSRTCGFISMSDFMLAAREVSPHLSRATLEDAFREVDRDGDGRISYRDFEGIMKHRV